MTKQKLEQIRDAVSILANISHEDWEELFEIIEDHCVASKISKKDVETEKNLDVRVRILLKELEIPVNLRGYKYLSYAIILYMKAENPVRWFKELYPKIAEKFNNTPLRVECSIRNAISIAWEKKYDPKLHTRIFGDVTKFKTGKPTNGQFIASIAEYLRTN